MNYKALFIAMLLIVGQGYLVHASEADSIGIEQEDDEIFVLHRVEPKETLYSLSRRYGASVESIVENNQISDNNLSVGAILRIPWSRGVSHIVEPGETLYSISRLYGVSIESIQQLNNLKSNDHLEVGMTLNITVGNPELSDVDREAENQHVVAPEETLYSISKKYNISVEDLRNWNRLSGNYVQAGDTLMLEPGAIPTAKNPEPALASASSTSIPVQPQQPVNPPSSNSSLEVKTVNENGIAAVISGNTDTKKYLALHPTAPVGTIMRVRNEMTNLSVFVRVVGQLPATGSNNNILIRLSPAAQEALGALDEKFRVELSYVPNQ